MLVNSVFPADALERLRGQRLVALTQARAQPGAIASRVFPRVIYGSEHPYGRVVTEGSIKSVTRDDVVAFHNTYFQPGRALVTVVGDVTAAGVKPVIERALADGDGDAVPWQRLDSADPAGPLHPAASPRRFGTFGHLGLFDRLAALLHRSGAEAQGGESVAPASSASPWRDTRPWTHPR